MCAGGQGRYEILRPKRTSLRRRVPEADAGALTFLRSLLTVDPALRPTAEQALAHPWLGCDHARQKRVAKQGFTGVRVSDSPKVPLIPIARHVGLSMRQRTAAMRMLP